MTIAELAVKSGVSAPHMSQVEREIKKVNNHLLRRIAEAFSVEPQHLLGAPYVPDIDT